VLRPAARLCALFAAVCLLLCGPAHAASYHALRGPIPKSAVRAYPAERPAGVALVLHGGGWQASGERALNQTMTLHDVGLATRAGWTAINADYRPGMQSVADTRRLYDWLRGRYGPRTPICVFGDSAGGHLGLMLAASRRDLDCVIAVAAPTDLTVVRQQSPMLWQLGVQPAFGVADLTRLSPIRLVSRMRAPMLLATVRDDAIVPLAQQREFLAAYRRACGMELRPGAGEFIHTSADRTDITRFDQAAVSFLRRVAAGKQHPVLGPSCGRHDIAVR